MKLLDKTASSKIVVILSELGPHGQVFTRGQKGEDPVFTLSPTLAISMQHR